MSTGIYQPETLEELRDLLVKDARESNNNKYAICEAPGSCLVARALESAPQNQVLTHIAVWPSWMPSMAHIVYVGPDGEVHQERLKSFLNDVARAFDREGDDTDQFIWSKEQCIALIDALIAARSR